MYKTVALNSILLIIIFMQKTNRFKMQTRTNLDNAVSNLKKNQKIKQPHVGNQRNTNWHSILYGQITWAQQERKDFQNWLPQNSILMGCTYTEQQQLGFY